VTVGYSIYEVPPPQQAAPPPLQPGEVPALPRRVTATPVVTTTWRDVKVDFGTRAVLRHQNRRDLGHRRRKRAVTGGVPVANRYLPAKAPASLAAVASEGAINLIWEANTETDLAGYVVLRGSASGATMRPLMTAPIKETTFRDTTVRAGARYVYAVVAVDTATPPNVSSAIQSGRGNGAVRSDEYDLRQRLAGQTSLNRTAFAAGWLAISSASGRPARDTGGLAGQRVLAPVVPSKIVAVALNYKAHAASKASRCRPSRCSFSSHPPP
jgi:hypothetical protein